MSPPAGYACASHERKTFCQRLREVALPTLLPLAAIAINATSRMSFVLAPHLIARTI
jgi:hypothetical protein